MSEEIVREMTVEELIEKNRKYLGLIESRYKEMQRRCEKLNDRCGYIELNSYGEGIKKGEQLMQERIDKIIDYWVNNPSILTQWFGGETTLFQLLEKTKQTCERIEREKESEKKEIHVGDIVEDIGGVKTLLVTNVVNPYVYALDKDGRDCVRNKNDVVKTGEHYPIDEFLKGLK